VKENGKSGLSADWIQWSGQERIDLTGYTSAFSSTEMFHGFIHFPNRVFQAVGVDTTSCKEMLAVRHFDFNFDSKQNSVLFFNARLYCRKSANDLSLVGRLGFTSAQ
jgi:hypothetical protein